MNKQNLDNIIKIINIMIPRIESNVEHYFDSDYHTIDLKAERQYIVQTVKEYGFPEWDDEEIPLHVFELVWGEVTTDEEYDKIVETQEYEDLLKACNMLNNAAACLVESHNIEAYMYELDMESTQASISRWVVNG